MKLILLILVIIVTTGFSQTPQDQGIFNLGEAFEKAGEYERAKQYYEELLIRNPENNFYLDAVLRTLSYLKKYDEALSISYKRLEKNSGDISLRAQIGGIFIRSGNFAKGDSVWKSILQSKDVSIFHFSIVAESQLKERLTDKAIETFVEGRKILNSPNLFRLEVAQLFYYTMNYSKSASEYLLYLKETPSQIEFIQSRFSQFTTKPAGLKAALSVLETDLQENESKSKIAEKKLYLWLLLEAKKYKEGIIIAKELNRDIKSDGEEIYQFALRLFKEKVYLLSMQLFEELIVSHPSFNKIIEANYFYTHSMESYLSDDENYLKDSLITFETVINGYQKIIEKYPHHSITINAIIRLAKINYEQKNDADKSLKLIDSVLNKNSNYNGRSNLILLSAGLLTAQGKLIEAEKRYYEVLNLPSVTLEERNSTNYQLAKLYYYSGKFDSTLNLLKSLSENYSTDESNDALKLQLFISENLPKYKSALKEFAKAELLIEQSKLSEAEEIFTLLTEANVPLADDAMLQLGKLNLQMKNYNEAIKVFQNFLPKFPISILQEQIYYLIGNTEEKFLKNKENAISAFQLLIEKYPNSIYSFEVRKRIRILRGDAI
ncbi:MAG: tetratricopeptide repeat protein [Bacteroidetes bacterium]|nr:tetratricopeptide repeat protein [Bacteroidota bacterium]